jgi:hypothetical protein
MGPLVTIHLWRPFAELNRNIALTSSLALPVICNRGVPAAYQQGWNGVNDNGRMGRGAAGATDYGLAARELRILRLHWRERTTRSTAPKCLTVLSVRRIASLSNGRLFLPQQNGVNELTALEEI